MSPAGERAYRVEPSHTDKWWGYEKTYHNDEKYCQKLLFMKSGGATSMHFHVKKHETLLVTNGTLTFSYIWNKETTVIKLEEGEAFCVPPGFVHKLSAEDGDVSIVEASTYDSADDSIRIS